MMHLVSSGDDAYRVEVKEDGEVRVEGIDRVLRVTPDGDLGCLVDDGRTRWHAVVSGRGEWREVFVDGEVYHLRIEQAARRPKAPTQAHTDQLTVPMPARVVAILARPGQQVRRGDIVITLEAMKMEMPLRAPRDGTVRAVQCKEGDLVQPGVSLIELV